jgi:apolipoprotein N-acyltransferase
VRPLPVLPAALLAALSGCLIALAFPGPGQWTLAPVGIAAFALTVRGQHPRRAAWLGLVTGCLGYGILLHWTGIYVGNLPWLALTALEASFVALNGALTSLAWRGRPIGVVSGVCGLWVLQEGVSSRWPFDGFPWARLAFSQTEAPTLGLASVGGAPLVSAAVAAAGAALAVAVVVGLERGWAARPRTAHWRGPAGLVAASIALMSVGALVPRPIDAPRSLAVAAVQGNVPHAGLDFNAQRRAVLDNHVAATLDLARAVHAGSAPAPALVIWPENSSDIDPLRNRDAAIAIQRATDEMGVPVLVGAVLQPSNSLVNAGIVWGPSDGSAPGPGAEYDKRHPAPFGEYIPWRPFFRLFSDKVDLVTHDFKSGSGNGVLPVTVTTGAGTASSDTASSGRPQVVLLGDVICFEIAFDDLVRDAVRGGADLLVVQTNNATFGYTDESIQQLAMSRLRAVESGRAVVHVSTVGVSALIGPDGRVLSSTGHFTREVMSAELPLRTAQTLATRVGAGPEALLSLVGLVIAFRNRRRRPTPHAQVGTASAVREIEVPA